jgi:hypothetical protein
MPKAYPVYDQGYREALPVLRDHLAASPTSTRWGATASTATTTRTTRCSPAGAAYIRNLMVLLSVRVARRDIELRLLRRLFDVN